MLICFGETDLSKPLGSSVVAQIELLNHVFNRDCNVIRYNSLHVQSESKITLYSDHIPTFIEGCLIDPRYLKILKDRTSPDTALSISMLNRACLYSCLVLCRIFGSVCDENATQVVFTFNKKE